MLKQLQAIQQLEKKAFDEGYKRGFQAGYEEGRNLHDENCTHIDKNAEEFNRLASQIFEENKKKQEISDIVNLSPESQGVIINEIIEHGK